MKVRLAESADEIKAAQSLRQIVFRGTSGLDQDRFDLASLHLLVIEEDKSAAEFPLRDGNLVGTYRMIPQNAAEELGGFYSAGEFELDGLLKRHADKKFLELGRSCTLPRARKQAVIELLWQGIWDHVRSSAAQVMIGCASFEGIDPSRHALALDFLARHASAPPEWQVKPIAGSGHALRQASHAKPDDRKILSGLPPLIKGYLRLGCYFGDGYVIDQAFNCIDVLVILPVSRINPRYFARFGQPL